MTTYQFLQENADLTHGQCITLGKQYFAKVLPAFRRIRGDRAIKMLRAVIFTCMATDNHLSELERDFMEQVFGYENMSDVAHLSGLSNYNTYDARNMYRNTCSELNKEEKTNLLGLVGVAVLCDFEYCRADADVIDHILSLE